MGRIPIVKNEIRKKQLNTKGAAPIEKNGIVVDEQGNEYEATYPKRARGLVKNGRARFVGENKICLACPPDKILEENKMEENKLTVKEILDAISVLTEREHHIEDALKQLETVRSEGPGDIGAPARAQAIAQIVETREATIRQTLSLYTKMYDDIQNEDAQKINLIKGAFDSNMSYIESGVDNSDLKGEALTYVTDKIAELVEKVVIDKQN